MGEPDDVSFYKTTEFWNYTVPYLMHCFVAFEDDRVTTVEYDD